MADEFYEAAGIPDAGRTGIPRRPISTEEYVRTVRHTHDQRDFSEWLVEAAPELSYRSA